LSAVLTEALRRQRQAEARIREVGEANVCTSVIVAAELRYGAAKKASARLSAQLELILAAFDVLPFETPADVVYGDIRAQLERAGSVIGGNDLLIAAQAVASGHTVVTDNLREFERVSGLVVANWLRAQRRTRRRQARSCNASWPGFAGRAHLGHIGHMRKMSLADAKARISELVDQAEHHGQRVVILRHGKPAAAIVPVEVALPKKRPRPRMSQAELEQSIQAYVAEFSASEPESSAVDDLLAGRR
jgi:tRNA(fMet)-specific endonuclease VapC